MNNICNSYFDQWKNDLVVIRFFFYEKESPVPNLMKSSYDD